MKPSSLHVVASADVLSRAAPQLFCCFFSTCLFAAIGRRHARAQPQRLSEASATSSFLMSSSSSNNGAGSALVLIRGGGALGGSPNGANKSRSMAPKRMASKGPRSSTLLSKSLSRRRWSAVLTVACFSKFFSNKTRSSSRFRSCHIDTASGRAGAELVFPRISKTVSVRRFIRSAPSTACRASRKSSKVFTPRFFNSSMQATVASSSRDPGVDITSFAFRSSR